MPFIQVQTNQNISDVKEQLKSELGSAITAIPGKSEAWLMVEIQDNLDMYFKGDSAPCAMFEIDIFGKAADSDYDELTRRICSIAEKYLSVSADRVYVKYAEIDHWGYNNFNF